MRLAPFVVAILLLVMALHSRGLTDDRRLLPLIRPVDAAAEPPNQSVSGQMTATEKSDKPAAVTKGMKKEQVQALWGAPVEVRTIRTCFGSREEWVYRGDARRYGGVERTLIFDEDDVLDEIK